MNLNLTTRYRNLLIKLAQEHGKLLFIADNYRRTSESCALRKSNGLLAKANALEREAQSLAFIISRNGAALRHFFGTSSLSVIAEKEIE